MQKTKIIIILVCLFLSGCQSRVVKYTSEDVTEYALQKAKTTQAEMIGVKQKNGDTIWTFQESYDRGLAWQTIDHHYYLDSLSEIERNELVNNYDLRVIAYFFQEYPDFKGSESISYTYLDTYPYTVIYHDSFSTRDSLKQCYDTLFAFLDYVKKENASYSDKSKEYEVQADLVSQNEHFVFHTSDVQYDEIEQNYLSYLILYHEDDALSDFTEEEISECRDTKQLKLIYFRKEEDDPWEATEYYCKNGELKISSCAFYDLLETMEDIQIEGDRDSFTITQEEEEYGPFEREMLSFYDVQNMTGIFLTNHVEETEESDTD